MKLLLHWVLSTGALLLIAHVLPLGVHVADFKTALIAALVLGLLNVSLKPILKILTLPIDILTLGLFGVIINGLLFWLVASFDSRFVVRGFWWAIIAALFYTALNHLIDWVLGDNGHID